MRKWTTCISALGAAVLATSSLEATTIYLEDFTDQEGKGAIGPDGSNPTVDTTGVSWTVDVGGTSMTATSDYMQVQDGVLAVRDPGGPADWISPVINISGYTDVQISIDMGSPSANYDEGIHEIQFLYSVDGNPDVEFFNADDIWGPVGTDNDAIPTGTFGSGVIPAGSTLQVRIATNTNSGSHSFWFDNITVTGVPEPAALSAIGLAGLILAQRRRRM